MTEEIEKLAADYTQKTLEAARAKERLMEALRKHFGFPVIITAEVATK